MVVSQKSVGCWCLRLKVDLAPGVVLWEESRGLEVWNVCASSLHISGFPASRAAWGPNLVPEVLGDYSALLHRLRPGSRSS